MLVCPDAAITDAAPALLNLCGMQSSGCVVWGVFFAFFSHPLTPLYSSGVFFEELQKLLTLESSNKGGKSGAWRLVVVVCW